MKAIVLAAGRGERLMPLTADRPKPLVDLGNGRTVLDEQVRAMREARIISRIVFVVGYRAEMVERHVSSIARHPKEIATRLNPFYGMSNNLASLWLAHPEMETDFLVTNGDNLFTSDVYRDLLADAGSGVTVAISPKAQFDFDDMKVSVDGGAITAIGKTLDSAVCQAESPGLVVVRGPRARATFRTTLDRLVRQPEMLQRFWLEVFNALIGEGTLVRPWYFSAASRWQEIDFHADMTLASDLIRAKAASLTPRPLRRTA